MVPLRQPGLYQVLEGIGEEQVQGDVQPIDILTLSETTSNTDVQPIVTNLNSYYNGAAVYARAPIKPPRTAATMTATGPMRWCTIPPH